MMQPNLFQPVRRFVDKLAKQGGKPLYELSPAEARLVLIKTQQAYPTQKVDAEVTDINIELPKQRQMPVRIVKPKDNNTPLPIIYYIHGGGWVMGDETTHDRLIRRLAAVVPAAVVFPIYTPAPEAQYPQITDDLFAALQQITQNADDYGLDAARLIVAGDSVGGNMATVMTLLAKKNNQTPRIDFQLLLYPVTDADFETHSYQEFAKGPWLTKKAMKWFWEQYAPDEKQRTEIYAAPLRASLEDLEDLPPALIITDENDVLRDEGEAYARKLDAAGVTVGALRVNGTIHDFLVLNALAETEPTREAFALVVQTLREVLD